jgi:MYXO-CTERM domain-containing protein
MRRFITLSSLALATALLTTIPTDHAEAFCGFYVAGADSQLYNNATMVVLMRDGTRTVLSMQNAYQGPPEDFAMVVPVPVVLQKDDVKVLADEVFDRVDKLAAPRLVEYWEQDPCDPYPEFDDARRFESGAVEKKKSESNASAREHGVTIEAQFEVGEYQVVILSAKDSTGLEKWLAQEKYNIPKGAEPLLRPYVQSGSKFFVAKVDAKKVKFGANGQAMLSPLRFHYDSPEFSLPVRLGLINAPDGQSGGKQDLIVHILARGQRYQLSNYPNVTIPTNLEVKNETREHFGEFYASLFDHVLANNPKAIVTEYAWAANSCDPCPEPPLSLGELITLGADVLPTYSKSLGKKQVSDDLQWSVPGEFVLTRLHARYDSTSLGEDLVFEAAPAIVGGREFLQNDGQLERGAVEEPGGWNNFQARYMIRHAWAGAIACDNPQRGIWGGPPDAQGSNQPAVARDLAFVARDANLSGFVTESAKAELERSVGKLPEGPSEPVTEPEPVVDPGESPTSGGPIVGYGEDSGCAHCSVERAGAGGALAFGLGLLGLLGMRRRKQAP